jgi:hypothetical protein
LTGLTAKWKAGTPLEGNCLDLHFQAIQDAFFPLAALSRTAQLLCRQAWLDRADARAQSVP